MKIYNLICAGCVECEILASCKSFTTKEAAREALRADYEETLRLWNFDTSEQTDDHNCYGLEDTGVAKIKDYGDEKGWMIEECEIELPCVSVAICVEGGMVQSVYTDGERVGCDVYDLDVSAFPDEGELDDVARQDREINAIASDPAWEKIW